MSDLEDLDDIADQSRKSGSLSNKPSAKRMRAGRRNMKAMKTVCSHPKWRRQLNALRSHGAKAAPVSVSTDSNLLDDSMRKKVSASMEAEQ